MIESKRVNIAGKYWRLIIKNGKIQKKIPEGEYQKRQRAVEQRRMTQAKKELFKTAVKTAVGPMPVIGTIPTCADVAKNVKVLIKKGKKEKKRK